MCFKIVSPGSSRVEGGLTDEEEEEEEANYLRWGGRVEPGSLDDRTEEKERRMEEGKTKVLNLLSKLQDEAPRPPNGSKGCSDFEDCELCQENSTINYHLTQVRVNLNLS